jgi:hypothetical protein
MQMPLIAAAVLGLHALLCWLLLIRTREVSIEVGSRSIEIVLIPPMPKAPLPKAPLPNRAPAQARALSKRESHRPPAAVPASPEPAQDNAIHPPVDFEAELARVAADAATAAAGVKPKDFGFPQVERPPAAEPEFGWDYARTHRVQQIDGGGLLVNLNDNCVLVFVPLPFVFCRPGHKPANGELFRDMKLPSLTGEAGPAP